MGCSPHLIVIPWRHETNGYPCELDDELDELLLLDDELVELLELDHWLQMLELLLDH